MSYRHTGLQNLVGRGSIVFFIRKDGREHVITLTKFRAARIYPDIRKAWIEGKSRK